ncbi:MAG: hypothetical protein JSR77_13585 [Planctomycetes bacterium]|nr:hypothetical protein [Planctomycetota bacterium]
MKHISAVVCALISGIAAAQTATFESLGFIPEEAEYPYRYTEAVALSADGAAASVKVCACAQLPGVWTRAGGLSYFSGPYWATPMGISDDGGVIGLLGVFGNAYGADYFYWERGYGVRQTELVSVFGVSGNGRYLLGALWYGDACYAALSYGPGYFDRQTGERVAIGGAHTIQGGYTNECDQTRDAPNMGGICRVSTPDGSLMFGDTFVYDRLADRVDPLPGWPGGTVVACSDDGAKLCGNGAGGALLYENGVARLIPGFTVRDMSADGSVLVGHAAGCDGAAIWTQRLGVVGMRDVLAALGVEAVLDWRLYSVAGISADGLTLAGDGIHLTSRGDMNEHESWIATIPGLPDGVPPLCAADFNHDGGVDGADVSDFFSAWERAEKSAEMECDGGIDAGDVAAFFVRWQNGC